MTSPDTDIEDPSKEGGDEDIKLSLEINVDRPSACERHVTVTVSRADIDRYYDKAYSEMMPKANVPGFRPGRAPRKLVESRFRQEVTEQIKGSLLLDSMTQVTEEQDFSVISEPDFDFEAVEIPDEGPLTFEFDLEVRPEFDVPKWKGLKLEKPVHEFTKTEIESHKQKLLSKYGILTPHTGAVDRDDFVVVDMTFRDGDRVVTEIREETIRVRPTLSFPDANLPDFDKLMIGAKAGDIRTGTATVSDDATQVELAGKKVQAKIEVLEVKRMTLPDMDDAFLSRIGVASEGDLLDAVKADLERQLAYHQQRRVRRQITALLTESADWDLPPELLRRQAHRELERAVMELQASGFTEEEIRAQENLLRQNSQQTTATALKEHFILERIAEDEDIDAEPGDFEEEVRLIAAQSNESPRSVRARIEKRGLMDTLRNQIIERKVIDLITSHATFNPVEFKQDRDETVAIEHAIASRIESDIPEAKHGGDVRELVEPAEHN